MLSRSPVADDESSALTFRQNAIPALAGACVAYLMLLFVLTPNTLSPIHHDDYSMLGAGFADMRLWVERPVSTNIVDLMGQGGPMFAFALLNLFALLVPTGTLLFVFRLLRIRVSLPIALAFGVMVFSDQSALWHAKYLGVITNLVSHAFGVGALLLLARAWERTSFRTLVFAAGAYALSAFAKEDFLLPPFVLLAYAWAELWVPRTYSIASTDTAQLQRRLWCRAVVLFVAVAGASVGFSALTRSPFTEGIFGGTSASAHYAVSLAPADVLRTFAKLTLEYARFPAIAALFAAVLLAVLWGDRRREVVALAVMVVSLVLPYSLIGNQAPAYRVFAWLPWLAALVVAPAALLWDRQSRFLKWRSLTLLAAAALYAVPWIGARQVSNTRLELANWYASEQRSNRAMLQTIEQNWPTLSNERVVGLIGLEGLSPWSNTEGKFLRRKLGYPQTWIVFVEKPSIFYAFKEPTPDVVVAVLPIERLCANERLMVLKFDREGRGVPVRAGQWCQTPEKAMRPSESATTQIRRSENQTVGATQ